MSKDPETELTDEQAQFVVERLACHEIPSMVAEALEKEHGVKLGVRDIERFDPTKPWGAQLEPRWRDLFEKTRKAFLAYPEHFIPAANRVVRVERLTDIARAFMADRDYAGVAKALNSITKELNGVFTLSPKAGWEQKLITRATVRNMSNEKFEQLLNRALAEAADSESSTKH